MAEAASRRQRPSGHGDRSGRSEDPDALRALLTASRRAELVRFARPFHEIEITDTEIYAKLPDFVHDPDVLVRTLRRMVHLARSLGGA